MKKYVTKLNYFSNIQLGLLQAVDLNFMACFSIPLLGRSKRSCNWHIFAVSIILGLLV